MKAVCRRGKEQLPNGMITDIKTAWALSEQNMPFTTLNTMMDISFVA
jgi:hypothetical protein